MIVPGDPDGCGALGLALQRAAVGIGQGSSSLAAARAGTACWQGSAGDSWRAAEARQQSAADSLAQAVHAAGRALLAFAAALADAQALAAAAVRQAHQAGLSIGATGAVAPVAVPLGPYASPAQEEQARTAGRRAQAREDVLRKVAAADAAEREAHDQLLRDLRAIEAPCRSDRPSGQAVDGTSLPRPGWNDWVDLVNGLVLAPGAALERATRVANERGAFAKQIKALTRVGDATARAAARKEWKAALVQMRAAQRAADAQALRVTRLQPASGWLHTASRPLSGTLPVVRHVPVLSVVMTGVGVGVDLDKGMDPGLAVVKNTASTAAGMAAGAATTAAVAALMTGGAVALAPVLAGVAVGAGVGLVVGWAVEEHGGEVAEVAQDLAEGVGDLAGSVWAKITG